MGEGFVEASWRRKWLEGREIYASEGGQGDIPLGFRTQQAPLRAFAISGVALSLANWRGSVSR
jgi:hypothetical protein